MRGRVTLVGAGPGSADLLTVRAVRALEQADVVFHDALVQREVLELAPRAQRFCVGKRAGRPSTAQATIHRLLVRAARRGKRVVRLKGGDPFVFGRGGEEGLALRAAGIPFEVVPGLSSALTAPALSGIPVTHRALASAVVIVSGHSESAWRPVLTAVPPASATLVVLMGLAARRTIARALIGCGWREGSPAAVLHAAATPSARRWIGTLSDLQRGEPAEDTEAPGTIVVGEVVALAAALGSREAVDEEGVRHAS